MARKMRLEGSAALAGLVLALVFAVPGIAASVGAIGTIILVIVGLVVGFTTIKSKERVEFMIVATLLAVVSGVTTFGFAGAQASGFIGAFFANMFLMIAPAAVLTAVIHFYAIGKN